MLQTILFFIAALVVALVVILVIRKANDDEGPHWAVVLLLVIVAGNIAYFGDAWLKERAVKAKTAEIIASMDDNLIFSAMKSSEPSLYAKVVKGVEDSEEAPEEERFDRFKTLTEPMVREFALRKVTNMTDDLAVRYGTSFAEGILSLAKAEPQSCMSKMKDMSKDPNVLSKLIGKEQFDGLMRDILMEPSQSSPPAMEASRAQMMLLMSLPTSASQLGMQFTPGVKPSEGDLCTLFGTSMKSLVTALPRNDAGAFVRSFVRAGAPQI